MSPLFSLFLCSHYMSFPLSIFNLLFFHFDHSSHCPRLIFLSYAPLPSILFQFSHPFVISSLCLTLLPSHSTYPFFLPAPFQLFFSSLCHLCPHHSPTLSSLPFSVFSSSCFPPSVSSASPPLQGVGGDDGWGTEHTDPPQRGSSSPALRQRPDGHLL